MKINDFSRRLLVVIIALTMMRVMVSPAAEDDVLNSSNVVRDIGILSGQWDANGALRQTVPDDPGVFSRMPGQPGHTMAANYIWEQLESIRENAQKNNLAVLTGKQTFTTPVLKDGQFTGQDYRDFPRQLKVISDPTGKTIPPFLIQAIWPNGVATNAVDPAAPIEGPLVYVGQGALTDMNGRIIGPTPDGARYTPDYYPGAILVMEYNSETNWEFAAALGAQAVIFLAPKNDLELSKMTQRTHMDKHYETPLEFKRYYVSQPDSDRLRDYLTRNIPGMATGKDIANYPIVRLSYKVKWDHWRDVNNLWLYIQGANGDINPAKKNVAYNDELVILTAYYDSFSVVPTSAPGASQSLSAATLLEFARFLTKNTAPKGKEPEFGNLPSRSILIVFNTAHFNTLQGVRELFRLENDAFQLRELTNKKHAEYTMDMSDAMLMLNDILDVVLPPVNTGDYDSNAAWTELGITSTIESEPRNTILTISKSKLQGRINRRIAAFDRLPADQKRGRERPRDYLKSLSFDPAVADKDAIDLSKLIVYGSADKNGSVMFRRSVLMLKRLLAIDRLLLIITRANMDHYTDKRTKNKKDSTEYEIAETLQSQNPAVFQGCGGGDPEKYVKNVASYIHFTAVESLKDTLAIEETRVDRLLGVYRRRDPRSAPMFRANRLMIQLKLEVIREHYLRTVRYRLNRRKKYYEMLADADTDPAKRRALGEAEKRYEAFIAAKRLEQESLRNELRKKAARIRSWIALYRILYGVRYSMDTTGVLSPRLGDTVGSCLAIDLSPGSKLVGMFNAGGLWREANSPSEFYKSDASYIQTLEAKVEKAVARKHGEDFQRIGPNEPSGEIYCVDTYGKRSWDTFLPDTPAFDSEIAHMAGLRSYTIATAFDMRPFCGYPEDRFSPDFYRPYSQDSSPVERRFVEHQLAFVGPFLDKLINVDFLTANSRIDNNKKASWVEIYGKCVKRTGNDVNPRTPVPRTLVEGRGQGKRAGGVLMTFLTASDAYGEFTLFGVRRNDIRIFLSGFVADDMTGEIVEAENITPVPKPLSNCHYVEATSPYVYDVKLQMFPARGVGVMELIDPRFMTDLKNLDVINARSDTTPLQWSVPYPVKDERTRVIFSSPDGRVKVLFRQGVFGVRMAMLNADPDVFATCMAHENGKPLQIIDHTGKLRNMVTNDVKGLGFDPRVDRIIRNPSLQAAIDFWTLDHLRMHQLRQRNIRNSKLDRLHETTKILIQDIAKKALKDQKYDEFFSAARSAWGSESRAYPDVMGTANDTVIGVLFYLFLLIPFCYFLERLLIGSIKIERLLVNVAFIFVIMFGLLWLIHPAFDLIGNPLMILLAFMILVLSLVVTAIIYGKFNTEMRNMQQGTTGKQSAEVNQSSAAFLAITLGINNMRKRKLRTALTCLTVIILTFTALSFTSVVHSVRNTRIAREYKPSYEGIYIRDLKWGPLNSGYLDRRYGRILTRTVKEALQKETANDTVSLKRDVIYARPLINTQHDIRWEFWRKPGKPPAGSGFKPLTKAMMFPRLWSLPANPQDTVHFDLIYEKDMGGNVARQVKIVLADHMIGLAADDGWQKYSDIMMFDTLIPKSTPVRRQQYVSDDDPSYYDPYRYRLFSSDDALECILPKSLMEELGMDIHQDFFNLYDQQTASAKAGNWKQFNAVAEKRRKKLSIWVGGKQLTVVGILNDDPTKGPLFDHIVDLDNEEITPVNFSGMTKNEQQTTQEKADSTDLSQAASQSYEHYPVERTIILPYKTAANFACTVRSISLRWIQPKSDAKTPYGDEVASRIEMNLRKVNKDYDEKISKEEKYNEVPSATIQETEDLLIRMEKNLWIGDNNVAWLYASSGKVGITGWSNLIMPLLISALIILNVMIGAVHERSREIGIFSALGLSPSHIGMLFLAESIVYATIGGMSGYMIGQIIAGAINHFGLLPGLTLNFSSLSTVFVTAIVMGSVIMSTLYPAMMASRIAVPSDDMRWGVPDPIGNKIETDLPFSFQRKIIPGISLFIYEFFQQHIESSVGSFNVKRVTIETFATDNGTGVRIFFMAWLTPYDLGVSQEVQLVFAPQDDELYFTHMVFHRISGEINDWTRVNLPFLNVMRKQFLIWRTYSPEQRAEYVYNGYMAFRDAFAASHWNEPEKPSTLTLAQAMSDDSLEADDKGNHAETTPENGRNAESDNDETASGQAPGGNDESQDKQ